MKKGQVKAKDLIEKRPCDHCHETYRPWRKWQRFCSSKCKNKAFWSTHKVVKVDAILQSNEGQSL